MNDFNYFELIDQMNLQNIWLEKQIRLEITTDQFIALLKGYQPGWEMRYGILYYKQDSYFYAYRSGMVVGKYRFEKNGDSGYCCTEMYDNPDKQDGMIIFEIIREACSQNNVEMKYDILSEMQMETERLNAIQP